MRTSDNIIKDGPKLSSDYFESTDDFYEDFSEFGQPGFWQPTTRTREPEGVWHDNLPFDNIGFNWVHPEHDLTINFETQKYVSRQKPAPNGFVPFSKYENKLRITTVPVDVTDEAMVQYARGRAYHMIPMSASESFATIQLNQPSSRIAKLSDFAPIDPVDESLGSRAGVILPQDEMQGIHPEYGAYNVEADGRVLFDEHPKKYLSGFMCTSNGGYDLELNRGWRVEARMRIDAGAEMRSETDVTQNDATFPAFWLLMQMYFNRDANYLFNQGLGNDRSEMPHTNSGVANECDIFEGVGHHAYQSLHTIHHHNADDGSVLAWNRQQGDNIVRGPGNGPPHGTVDYTTRFCDFGCDMTPEKLGFYIDEHYVYTVRTPPQWFEQMAYYRTDQGNRIIKADGRAIVDGYRTKENGDPQHMVFQILVNMAMSAKFVLDLMYGAKDNRGTAPGFFRPILPEMHMDIEYIRTVAMKEPLADSYGPLYAAARPAGSLADAPLATRSAYPPSGAGGGVPVQPPAETGRYVSYDAVNGVTQRGGRVLIPKGRARNN